MTTNTPLAIATLVWVLINIPLLALLARETLRSWKHARADRQEWDQVHRRMAAIQDRLEQLQRDLASKQSDLEMPVGVHPVASEIGRDVERAVRRLRRGMGD